ncbi:MAG TPA: hypothetical protein ENJ27_01615 [Candidatus Moranbacteria bacterium]|nr:hypothetical protein [Candidatus Moranbacteria bacterium]
MPLKDTEKKLYDDNTEIEKRAHSDSIFDLNYENRKTDKENKFSAKKKWWNKIPFFQIGDETRAIIYIGIIALGSIAMISGIVLGVYKFKKTAFAEDRINISITGKENVNSAQAINYFIEYENKNRTALKNVEILLNYPENFYPEKSENLERVSDRSSKILIGNLKAHSKGKIEIKGKFYAAENYTAYLQATMRYTPANFNSIFQIKSQIGVRILSSPIKIKLKIPKEALNESSIEYEINYTNDGSIPLNDLNLKVVYPDGFTYQGAEPAPIDQLEKGNIWHLGELKVNDTNVIKIKGKINGNRNDVKLIKAIIFKNGNNKKEIIYSKTDGLTKIVVPPLMITHKVNGESFSNVNLGDVLMYKINYANKGDINLRDVIIRLKIDSPIIDYQNMKLKTGAFEDASKTITWKASDIEKLKNLEPGATGIIDLEIPLKKEIKITDATDKNFTIKSLVTISSSDVPYDALGASKNISNEVIIKLNSKISLENQIFFNDKIIGNSGPIPPKIGKETTYTVHWRIYNLSNNISNTQVKTHLPTWVKWKGKTSPENENITFNSRTNEIIWNVGGLSAGTGYLSPTKDCSFQIGIVPEINQINKPIDLLLETTLIAKDDFTSSVSTVKSGIKTTRIPNDKEVDATGYLVTE